MGIYHLTVLAESDLSAIWDYTPQRWSLDQADRFLSSLNDKMKMLADSPDEGRNASFIEEGLNYLFYSVQSHIIFYTVVGHQEIRIDRILHYAMDLPSRIRD